MLAMIAAAALGESTVSESPTLRYNVQPWTEAVVSVEDIASAKRLFVEHGDWQVSAKGQLDRSELAYWNLPGTVTGEYERVCAPKVHTGCIRFVSFKGVEQRPVRLAARAWDTGGIYSIMVRSDNVPALFDAAIKMGWWAESEPVRFQFGQSDLRNVVLTGPHGINIAVYERISPAFTAFPVGLISQGFNSMRMVKDRPKSRDFYRDLLGFSVLFDSANEPADPARSNFGIPLNYTPTIKRAAAALQPQPGETGRVEVMQIDGFTGGSDYSSLASPPNLGIISLRYPVDDLAAYRASLERRGVKITYSATKVKIGGGYVTDIFAVRDPDGNITEFYDSGSKALAKQLEDMTK